MKTYRSDVPTRSKNRASGYKVGTKWVHPKRLKTTQKAEFYIDLSILYEDLSILKLMCPQSTHKKAKT